MGLIARVILVVAGAFAALFVARDSLHFPIIAAVIAILLIAVTVIAAGLLTRRRQSENRTTRKAPTSVEN